MSGSGISLAYASLHRAQIGFTFLVPAHVCVCACVEYLQFSVETVQRQFNLADRAMKLVPEQTGLHTAKLLWLKVLPKNRLGLTKAYSKCYLLILPVLSILKTKDYRIFLHARYLSWS